VRGFSPILIHSATPVCRHGTRQHERVAPCHWGHGFATGAVSGTLGTTKRPSLEKAESYQFGAIGAPPLTCCEAQPADSKRMAPMNDESTKRMVVLVFMELESVTGA